MAALLPYGYRAPCGRPRPDEVIGPYAIVIKQIAPGRLRGLATRIGQKNIHPRWGWIFKGLDYHASPARDARNPYPLCRYATSPPDRGSRPSDSEHKQQTGFAWFAFLTPVHPRCSQRLRRLDLFFFHSLRSFDSLLLSGRGAIRSHRHLCRRGPFGFELLGRSEFALRNSAASGEIYGAKAPNTRIARKNSSPGWGSCFR